LIAEGRTAATTSAATTTPTTSAAATATTTAAATAAATPAVGVLIIDRDRGRHDRHRRNHRLNSHDRLDDFLAVSFASLLSGIGAARARTVRSAPAL